MSEAPTTIPLSPRERGRGEGRSSKIALPPELKEFARQLREQQTEPESTIWFLLRDRRFQGLKFRRQHAVPPYVLDFYCEELKLTVELDGGQHNADSEQVRDEQRSAYLNSLGIEVVRYWNHDVLNRIEDVLQDLMQRVSSRQCPSSGPSGHLLPEGEGTNPSPSGRGARGEGLFSNRKQKARA